MVRETGVQYQVESYQRLKKMVLDIALLNAQHYKIWIKGKVEQSRERSNAFPAPRCSRYWKGSLRLTLDWGRQLIYIYIYIPWRSGRFCKYTNVLNLPASTICIENFCFYLKFVFTTHRSHKQYVIQGQFLRGVFISLNSEFSFSQTRCHTKLFLMSFIFFGTRYHRTQKILN